MELTSGVRDFLKVLDPAKRKENSRSEKNNPRKISENSRKTWEKSHKTQKLNLSQLPMLFSVFWLQIPKKNMDKKIRKSRIRP